jgi:hypothetical protein
MNILLTLFADVNDQGEFVLIWHGEDVTYHHQSMDDLQKRQRPFPWAEVSGRDAPYRQSWEVW